MSSVESPWNQAIKLGFGLQILKKRSKLVAVRHADSSRGFKGIMAMCPEGVVLFDDRLRRRC